LRIEAAEPQLRVENSTNTDFYDNFQFSIFNSQFSILNFQFSIFNSQLKIITLNYRSNLLSFGKEKKIKLFFCFSLTYS